VAGLLVLESLKKRRSGIYRRAGAARPWLEARDLHGARDLQGRRGKGRSVRLWPWSRMTGWRAVHTVMVAGGLDGPHASPKDRGSGQHGACRDETGWRFDGIAIYSPRVENFVRHRVRSSCPKYSGFPLAVPG
jgi:hypothetical protein